jgi:hypothetical protein
MLKFTRSECYSILLEHVKHLFIFGDVLQGATLQKGVKSQQSTKHSQVPLTRSETGHANGRPGVIRTRVRALVSKEVSAAVDSGTSRLYI